MAAASWQPLTQANVPACMFSPHKLNLCICPAQRMCYAGAVPVATTLALSCGRWAEDCGIFRRHLPKLNELPPLLSPPCLTVAQTSFRIPHNCCLFNSLSDFTTTHPQFSLVWWVAQLLFLSKGFWDVHSLF